MGTASLIIVLNTTMLILSATVTSIQSCVIMKEVNKNAKD